MQKHSNTKRFFTFLLVILTTFSSCTVRKAMQADSHMEVTKTLNPIKSASVGSAHCASYDEVAVASHYENFAPISRIFFEAIPQEIFSSFSEEAKAIFLNLRIEILSPPIPIYILFRQLKAFI